MRWSLSAWNGWFFTKYKDWASLEFMCSILLQMGDSACFHLLAVTHTHFPPLLQWQWCITYCWPDLQPKNCSFPYMLLLVFLDKEWTASWFLLLGSCYSQIECTLLFGRASYTFSHTQVGVAKLQVTRWDGLPSAHSSQSKQVTFLCMAACSLHDYVKYSNLQLAFLGGSS